MGKIITKANRKKVELGKDETCVFAQPRGWGTSCRVLTLKADGLYHCADCGLVFKKPKQKTVPNRMKICECKRLTNFLEWFFDSFFGYDCPHGLYRCPECKRTYHSPDYATIKFQESPAAIEHVRLQRKFDSEQAAEKKSRLREAVEELRNDLKGIPAKERAALLKQLR